MFSKALALGLPSVLIVKLSCFIIIPWRSVVVCLCVFNKFTCKTPEEAFSTITAHLPLFVRSEPWVMVVGTGGGGISGMR